VPYIVLEVVHCDAVVVIEFGFDTLQVGLKVLEEVGGIVKILSVVV
jgi:hypothetical protein